MRNECNNKCSISGHLYKLKKRICLPDKVNYKQPALSELEIGRTDTDSWWMLILADRGINAYASELPNHFERICKPPTAITAVEVLEGKK